MASEESLANNEQTIRASIYEIPEAAELRTAEDGGNTTRVSSVSERMLAEIFTNQSNSTTPKTKYSEATLQKIVHILRLTQSERWSVMPRIYTVLRTIDQLKLIDEFINQGCSDIEFPFTLQSLPPRMPPSIKAQFISTQSLVLTQALDLEKTEGKHATFAADEPLWFESRGKLGRGAFGEVDKVVSLITLQEYARKRIRRKDNFAKSREAVKEFKTELAILKTVKHPHCIRLVGSYTDPVYLGLIMTPVADCDLVAFFDKALKSEDDQSFLRGYFGCLASALKYLHDNQIRHRDIKPANILVKGDNVYLTDFGIAFDWSELTRGTTTEDSGKTAMYCAPEIARSEPRGAAADIWSLGCVFVEMVSVLKHKSVEDMRSFFMERSKSYWFHRNEVPCKDWLAQLTSLSSFDNSPISWCLEMLVHDETKRLTAHQLLEVIQQDSAFDPLKSAKQSYCGDCCMQEDNFSVHGSEDYDDAWVDSEEEAIAVPDASPNLDAIPTEDSKVLMAASTEIEQVQITHANGLVDLGEELSTITHRPAPHTTVFHGGNFASWGLSESSRKYHLLDELMFQELNKLSKNQFFLSTQFADENRFILAIRFFCKVHLQPGQHLEIGYWAKSASRIILIRNFSILDSAISIAGVRELYGAIVTTDGSIITHSPFSRSEALPSEPNSVSAQTEVQSDHRGISTQRFPWISEIPTPDIRTRPGRKIPTQENPTPEVTSPAIPRRAPRVARAKAEEITAQKTSPREVSTRDGDPTTRDMPGSPLINELLSANSPTASPGFRSLDSHHDVEDLAVVGNGIAVVIPNPLHTTFTAFCEEVECGSKTKLPGQHLELFYWKSTTERKVVKSTAGLTQAMKLDGIRELSSCFVPQVYKPPQSPYTPDLELIVFCGRFKVYISNPLSMSFMDFLTEVNSQCLSPGKPWEKLELFYWRWGTTKVSIGDAAALELAIIGEPETGTRLVIYGSFVNTADNDMSSSTREMAYGAVGTTTTHEGYEVLPGGRIARMSELEGHSRDSSPRRTLGAVGAGVAARQLLQDHLPLPYPQFSPTHLQQKISIPSQENSAKPLTSRLFPIRVTIVSATGLHKPEIFTSPSPYVVTMLEPTRIHKYTTQSRFRTLNPVFGESFNIDATKESVFAFEVFDRRPQGEADRIFLGLSKICIGDVIYEGQKRIITTDLRPRLAIAPNPPTVKGKITLEFDARLETHGSPRARGQRELVRVRSFPFSSVEDLSSLEDL